MVIADTGNANKGAPGVSLIWRREGSGFYRRDGVDVWVESEVAFAGVAEGRLEAQRLLATERGR